MYGCKCVLFSVRKPCLWILILFVSITDNHIFEVLSLYIKKRHIKLKLIIFFTNRIPVPKALADPGGGGAPGARPSLMAADL